MTTMRLVFEVEVSGAEGLDPFDVAMAIATAGEEVPEDLVGFAVETMMPIEAEIHTAPKLDAVKRVVFLHGKENPESVVYREAVAELADLGVELD